MALTSDGIPYVGPSEYSEDADFPAVDQDQAMAIQGLITSLKADIAAAKATAVPVGTIIMWSGLASKIPTGWLVCNGQPHNSSGLLAALGTASTPNLVNRFVVGAGPAYVGKPASIYNVTNEGGSQANGQITLTAAQSGLRNHGHGTANASTNHVHGLSTYGFDGNAGSGGSHAHQVKLLKVSGTPASDADGQGVQHGNSGGWSAHPPHGETVWTGSEGAHTHGGNTNWQSDNPEYWGGAAHVHAHTVNDSGSAIATEATDIRPHYYAVIYLIKAV